MNFIKRYLPDTLSQRDKIRQRKELTKSRKLYKVRKYYTRKSVKSFTSKPSKHVIRARKLYGVDHVKPTRELSKRTGCSLKGLRQIVRKGEGAYFHPDHDRTRLHSHGVTLVLQVQLREVMHRQWIFIS